MEKGVDMRIRPLEQKKARNHRGKVVLSRIWPLFRFSNSRRYSFPQYERKFVQYGDDFIFDDYTEFEKMMEFVNRLTRQSNINTSNYIPK